MNIEILPPEEKIEYLGQPITLKDAVQVELDHLLKCAWATFTSHQQELTLPTYPLRRHGDTITPLRIRYADDDGRAEEAQPHVERVSETRMDSQKMGGRHHLLPTNNESKPTTSILRATRPGSPRHKTG